MINRLMSVNSFEKGKFYCNKISFIAK